MGFFSSIGSFIGGICSSIGGAIGGLCGVVSSALSILSGGVASAVIGLVMGLGKLLGKVDENEKPEELGMRAAKAEKKLEDFDNFDEYKSYLNSIELTAEDMKEIDKHREEYAHIGTGVCLQGVNECYSRPMSIDDLISLQKMGVKNPEEIKTFLDNCEKKNVRPSVNSLVTGKNITPEESDKVLGILNSTFEKMETSKLFEDVLKK